MTLAAISGPISGSVTEAGGVTNGTPGIPTATGDLNSTDIDNPTDAWNVPSLHRCRPTITSAPIR